MLLLRGFKSTHIYSTYVCDIYKYTSVCCACFSTQFKAASIDLRHTKISAQIFLRIYTISSSSPSSSLSLSFYGRFSSKQHLFNRSVLRVNRTLVWHSECNQLTTVVYKYAALSRAYVCVCVEGFIVEQVSATTLS